MDQSCKHRGTGWARGSGTAGWRRREEEEEGGEGFTLGAVGERGLTEVGELHSLTDWHVSEASEDAELEDFCRAPGPGAAASAGGAESAPGEPVPCPPHPLPPREVQRALGHPRHPGWGKHLSGDGTKGLPKSLG